MNSYKARGECALDIFRLLDLVCPANWNAKGTSFGVEIEFETDKTITAVRRLIQKIPDGHVMLETVNFTDWYDGERYYRP